MTKQQTRELFLQKRDAFDATCDVQDRLTSSLVKFLKSESGVWAGYRAMRSEADPKEAIECSSHLKWVYPRVDGEQLEFLEIGENSWKMNEWGVEEPLENNRVIEKSEINGYLVPGIAFHRSGHRVGYGKGYYDRELSKRTSKKVGVCYSVQIADQSFETSAHDIPVEYIATEEGILEVQRRD